MTGRNSHCLTPLSPHSPYRLAITWVEAPIGNGLFRGWSWPPCLVGSCLVGSPSPSFKIFLRWAAQSSLSTVSIKKGRIDQWLNMPGVYAVCLWNVARVVAVANQHGIYMMTGFVPTLEELFYFAWKVKKHFTLLLNRFIYSAMIIRFIHAHVWYYWNQFKNRN